MATITNIEIEELTDVNAITINVTGPGEYEYSLDDQFGFTKIQNYFGNVPAGIYEIYVKDKMVCGIVNKSIAVLGLQNSSHLTE
jgi:hypothetical protein